MPLSSSVQAALTGCTGERPIIWNAPLASWTTFRIGGPADALVTACDTAELRRILRFCDRERINWRVLGRGSNILAADSGFRGVIIVLDGKFKYIVRQQGADRDRPLIRVGAAVSLTRLAEWCRSEGYAGLEFAAGIPGTVAGAVIMNAGAWGGSMAQIVDTVDLVGIEGSASLTKDELHFAYRSCSRLKAERGRRVVGAVQFTLKRDVPERIGERMRELQEQRRASQPIGLASSGCIFKNPEGMSAGRIIDEAGLKGQRVGDAEVSAVHANFIVNRGRAQAADVLALIETVRDRVRKTHGVDLDLEIEVLSDEPDR